MSTLLLLLAMMAFAAAQTPSVNPRNATDYGCWIKQDKYWLVGVGSDECASVGGTWKKRYCTGKVDSPHWCGQPTLVRPDNSAWHGVGE